MLLVTLSFFTFDVISLYILFHIFTLHYPAKNQLKRSHNRQNPTLTNKFHKVQIPVGKVKKSKNRALYHPTGFYLRLIHKPLITLAEFLTPLLSLLLSPSSCQDFRLVHVAVNKVGVNAFRYSYGIQTRGNFFPGLFSSCKNWRIKLKLG